VFLLIVGVGLMMSLKLKTLARRAAYETDSVKGLNNNAFN